MSDRRGYRRLRLRRADGAVYLNRWGWRTRFGAILLHRMDAPDPGVDLHDHPWWFASIVLWGGYREQRAPTRDASAMAVMAEMFPDTTTRGVVSDRRWMSVRSLGLHECHRITNLRRRPTWTLVVTGPRRRPWGFYLPDGWIDDGEYDRTVRADRRDLWTEDFEMKR